jgi:N-methylhydantoinase A
MTGRQRTASPKGKRPVYFFGRGFVSTKVYERTQLQGGHKLAGPCLVEETTSTTVVPPEYTCRLDHYGSLLIEPASGRKPIRAGKKAVKKSRTKKAKP